MNSSNPQDIAIVVLSRSGLATESVAGLEAWSDPVSPITCSEINLLIATNSQAGISSDE